MCGKEVEKYEDYLEVVKKWGYDSDFDGEEHAFELCRACYKQIIGRFKIPTR